MKTNLLTVAPARPVIALVGVVVVVLVRFAVERMAVNPPAPRVDDLPMPMTSPAQVDRVVDWRGLIPAKLGPARKHAPASLAALLRERKTPSTAALRDAVQPYIGAKVRWRLRSWGGEASSAGYVVPTGTLPPTQSGGHLAPPMGNGPGRIRYISLELGAHADLSTVEDAASR